MSKKSILWLGLASLLTGYIALFSGVSALAVANSISRTYKTNDKELTIGMAVSLGSTNQTEVVRSKPENSKSFLGIVSKGSDNLITLSSPLQDVIVTTNGPVSALVSDLNGSVKKGDILAVSPLEGVLMRASDLVDTQQYPAVGLALSEPKKVSEASVKDASGADKQVAIATAHIELDSSLSGKTDYNGTAKRSTLVVFARSMTGKWVSEWQALGAFAVFITVLLTVAVIVYGTVRSAIMALGRNPLSRKVIAWQIFRVLGLALGLFIFGSLAAFFILWF